MTTASLAGDVVPSASPLPMSPAPTLLGKGRAFWFLMMMVGVSVDGVVQGCARVQLWLPCSVPFFVLWFLCDLRGYRYSRRGKVLLFLLVCLVPLYGFLLYLLLTRKWVGLPVLVAMSLAASWVYLFSGFLGLVARALITGQHL
jgi:hypothetical protein